MAIPKKESNKIELKPVLNNAVIEALVAFSNAKGGTAYPGRLPDSISIEDLLSNNYSSIPRNKKIAEVFKDMGLIEKYGSGIKRIMGYFKEENLPAPDFRNISDGFMVTVFCAATENGAEMVEKTVEKTAEAVENAVEKILGVIAKNPQVTQQKLADITGLTRRGVEWNLSKLKAKGLIERVGPDRGGYWTVKTVEKTVGAVEKVVEETVENAVEKTAGAVEKVLDAIAKNPQATQQKLADITGLTRRGVEWNLSKLKTKGLIERVGPDRGGHWRVIKHG